MENNIAQIRLIGIDLGKNAFHLCGVDRAGRVLMRKRLRRDRLGRFIEGFPRSVIVMEACGGANYWAREARAAGHEAKLIAPQFVKPYVKSQKNDDADAEAVCEAAQRPTMRFVAPRGVEQQDIQSIHRIRERLVKQRTGLVNEIRGLLLEYGVAIPKGIWNVPKRVLQLLQEEDERITPTMKELLQELLSEFHGLSERIERYDNRIKQFCQKSPACQRLCTIPGVGPLTASAVLAAVGDIGAFKNGRQFSAWLGLVPRQHTTGGKPKLLGISKRGNPYLRTLLIHGARATLQHVMRRKDRRSLWAQQLYDRRGYNRTAVALANKNARVIWALLSSDTDSYQEQLPVAA